MYHLRQRSDNFFFKANNPVFANEGTKTETPEISAEEDPTALEYMKSQERKYEPRKIRKTQNAYVRMESIHGVRKSLAQIATDDLVEFCILSPSSFDFAMLLYKLYGSQYRCIDMVNQKWQRNDNNAWIDDITCVGNLKRIISDNLTVFFRNKLASIRALLENKHISTEIAKPLELKSKNLEHIAIRLTALNIKNLIMKDATEIFFYSEIFEATDEN